MRRMLCRAFPAGTGVERWIEGRRKGMQRNDILKLLFETPYEALRERADEVRAREKGEHVFVRGLIEFSNRCERNCRYCGLRSANPSLKRYRLDEAQIVEAAERAVAFGVDTLVLQSGEVHDEPQRIAHVVDALRTRFPVAVTLSVGEQPTASYALWKEAGASRFRGCQLNNDAISFQLPLTWNLAKSAIVRSTISRVLDTTIDFLLKRANQCLCLPLFCSRYTVCDLL